MSSVHIAPEEEGGQCGSSLVQTYEMLKSQLDLEGNMPDVFSRACVMLGAPAEGAILDQAARCRAALLGDGSRPRPKPEDVVKEAPVLFVVKEAPVWQGETPVFPQEGAPVIGCAVAKVVGEAAPQHEEMAREASKMIIKITSVDHDSGRVGMYFNFNRNDVGLEIRDPRRRDDDGHNARHRKTMYIMVTHAPANGGKRQTGQVVVWGNKRGGSTGDAHGRFNSRPIKPAVRQFSVGDILVVESIHFREKDAGAPPPPAASSCACQIL